MERESGGDRSVERVNAAAGGEPADRAASAPNSASHAFVLVADDQDRRAVQVELADSVWSMGVETDDRDAAFARGG